MRFLRSNTATITTVGPFYDKTDGVTIETGLTITNEKISFTVDLNDGSAPTLVLDNITGAASGTANDLNYITNCDAGLMQLELAAANVNYLGRAFLTITDAANHCPVFHEFTILPANVYDSLILGSGTGLLDISVVQWNGTAVHTPGTAGIPEVAIHDQATVLVDAILDEIVEGTLTLRQIQRIVLAVLAGKSGGGGTTTDTFRDVADTKNRVSATVNNLGNRTAVTLDGS